MTNIPGTKWPLLESYTLDVKLQENLSKVPADKLAPAPGNIFKALELTNPEDVKVIIIGQDPYIRGEAHGLSFSSPLKMTPSLKVVFDEVEFEYGSRRLDTDLTSWAKQGVLLLNTILTTELGQSLAHTDFGWTRFTQEVVRHVLTLGSPISVLLWGRHAQEFWDEVLDKVHDPIPQVQVLTAYHPQAQNYDATKKFVGCGHFRQANNWLVQHDKTPINWLK